MLSVFMHVTCFLSDICLNRSLFLNAFRRPDDKGKIMHMVGLISDCTVQVISPLDGSFAFLLVLGKQVPSIAGVKLEILVNC